MEGGMTEAGGTRSPPRSVLSSDLGGLSHPLLEHSSLSPLTLTLVAPPLLQPPPPSFSASFSSAVGRSTSHLVSRGAEQSGVHARAPCERPRRAALPICDRACPSAIAWSVLGRIVRAHALCPAPLCSAPSAIPWQVAPTAAEAKACKVNSPGRRRWRQRQRGREGGGL